jgi:hypothetical protein
MMSRLTLVYNLHWPILREYHLESGTLFRSRSVRAVYGKVSGVKLVRGFPRDTLLHQVERPTVGVWQAPGAACAVLPGFGR